MATENPKIRYVIIGFENKILVDHFEKMGDLVSFTSDVFFPSIKKKGLNMQTREQYFNKHGLHLLV